MKKNSKV